MKINIIIEKELQIQIPKLKQFLNSNSTFLNFEVYDSSFTLDDSFIVYPTTHFKILEQYTDKENDSEFNFHFTNLPYANNFFFEGLDSLVPFSFYAWNYLTNLPIENGILFFIINYLARELENEEFRHEETTGCMYDFLWNKEGVDDGMRQASFCKNCLENLEKQTLSEKDESILNDLKTLMDLLSNSSKWNKSILERTIESQKKIKTKRKAIELNEINIAIASPSDLTQERELLLNTLERKFRTDQHEKLCKHRLKVHGWEDLPSQNGYPQEVINERIISKVDIVLAIFKHKLGTPTIDTTTGKEKYPSGTAEEILFALDKDSSDGPLGMVYFYSTPPAPSLEAENYDKIKKEWDRLKEFRKTIQSKVIYKPFTSKEELIEIVSKDIMNNILELFEKV